MRIVLLTLILLVAGSLAQRNIDSAARVSEFLKNAYRLPSYSYQAPADDKTNILNFVKGFLNGIGSSSVFDNVKTCINDDKTVVTDIITAVEDIETKVASKVEEGIALIGKAVEIIPTAVQQCKVAGADLQTLLKMVQTFKNPASFLYYVGKSLVINRVDVLKEVNSAVKSYQTQDFNNFGYWIGRAMDTILLGQKIAMPKDTQTDVVNFVKGFLSGVGSSSIFDNIKTCITDSDTFVTDIYTGIEDIKTKNADKVKQGIILLGQAAQIVPAAAKSCQASEADVQKFISFAKSFTNPEAFLYFIGKSLLINHVEVIHEVTSAVKAYDDKDYVNLGYWVGKAMDTIVIGQGKTKDTQTDVVNFVRGFLTGVASETIFDSIKTCIIDVDTVTKDIAEAVVDLKSKDPAKVKAGIALLGKAAQVIPNAAKFCKASEADVQKFVKFAKSFTDPEAFLYYIGKSLLINHVEIIHEVNNAVAAYDTKNFTDLGFWVGKAMDTIILGDSQVITEAFVNHLNKLGQWKAGIPEKFKGMTFEQIKKEFLGAKLVDYSEYKNLTVFNYEGIKDIPASFNSSAQWPGCVHDIRDQGHCGSCWAFAASEVLSDRFCIASNGSVQVVLSPQYLLSCNNVLDHGCNGGTPLFSWWFLVSDGLVTDSCLPYASYNGTQPIKCKEFTTCADGAAIKNYHASKGSVVQLPNPASIQANILQYGPVEAGFTVYSDFMSYAGGVYTHQSGSVLGGHAVKIIGWGNENGTNYWIVANSWGPTWGENGFFRIAFGQCGIDAGVVTGQADLTRLSQTRIPSHWW